VHVVGLVRRAHGLDGAVGEGGFHGVPWQRSGNEVARYAMFRYVPRYVNDCGLCSIASRR
jgi:hypothetical protein